MLVGAHTNGADIDSDEERVLGQLAVNAGAAYDHIQAERVLAEMDWMRIACSTLQLEASS